MGSRDKDQTAPHHQPHISSLVVRPSVSDGADGAAAVGGGGGGGGRGGGSDYEPGEVRRDPPFSRSDRYNDDPAIVACKNLGLEEGILMDLDLEYRTIEHVFYQRTVSYYIHGYRIRAGSSSPVRRRDADQRYGSDFDHSGGPPRNRDFGSRRDPGRYRDNSPPYARGRIGGRPFDRGLDGPGFGPGPFRGDGMSRNNPNVRPREGDWICPDPLCRNLNFARREYCNNCKRHRYAPGGGSPRRGFPDPPPPPPHAPPRRFPGPPMVLSPGRNMNGYRSPPRAWGRDGPREFGAGGLAPLRHEGRFSDHIRRDRLDYPEDDYRGRSRLDRPVPVDWGHRDRGRDGFLNERRIYERRVASPPPPPPLHPHRSRWGRDMRERSRSPIRGDPILKDYRRDMYMERGREDRRGMARDRVGDAY